MNEPLVTIAIPTMNRADFLRSAIRSAVDQSYPNVEVLVSDNASSDGTAAVLEEASHPRFRSWTQPVNLGMAGNWNFLLQQAKGEYFCLLSDDDFLHPHLVQRLMEGFQHNPGVTLAYSGCELTDEISTLAFTGYPQRESGLALLERILRGSQVLYLCSILTPTELLRKKGFPNYPYALDFAGWLPLLLQGDVFHCAEILSYYTAHSGSETANIKLAAAIKDIWDIVAICSSDSRVPPDLRKRFLSLGTTLVARLASRQFLQRAALGSPKTKLMKALPSLARFMAYDLPGSVPVALAAILLPVPVLRRMKLRFREKRARSMKSAPFLKNGSGV